MDFASQGQEKITYVVDQIINVSMQGNNPLNAIRNFTFGDVLNGNSLTMNVATFGNTNNAGYGMFYSGDNPAFTPGTGFTQVGIGASTAETVTQLGINQNSIVGNWSGSPRSFLGIGCELIAAPVQGGSFLFNFV